MANTTNLDLVKPLGTDHALISVINGNMDKVDAYAGKVNESLAGIQDGLAIVAVGDTHAAITSGQFVYVKEHNTLPEGLYTASTNIAANGALSTSNLTADSKGGLNALSDQIGTLNNKIPNVPQIGKLLKDTVIGTTDTSHTITDLSKYNLFMARINSSFAGGPAIGLRYSATEIRFFGTSLASGGAMTYTLAYMKTNGDAFTGWDTDGNYTTKWGTNVTGVSHIYGIA